MTASAKTYEPPPWTWDWLPTATLPGSVTVKGRRPCSYYVSRVEGTAPEFGACYRLEKWGIDEGSDAEEREYHVSVKDGHAECSCKGFSAHSHCRHTGPVLELVESEATA